MDIEIQIEIVTKIDIEIGIEFLSEIVELRESRGRESVLYEMS